MFLRTEVNFDLCQSKIIDRMVFVYLNDLVKWKEVFHRIVSNQFKRTYGGLHLLSA